METLLTGLAATHEELSGLLGRAESARPDRDPRHVRDDVGVRDEFLVACCRHLSAIESVLVPTVRHRLPDGTARARELLRQCKRLEIALAQVRAKISGSAYAVRRPWPSVWCDVRREFDATCAMERRLVSRLVDVLGDEEAECATRLHDAEVTAPTRPHPYLPHLGVPGRMARRVARRVDVFWDATQGRGVPEPRRGDGEAS